MSKQYCYEFTVLISFLYVGSTNSTFYGHHYSLFVMQLKQCTQVITFCFVSCLNNNHTGYFHHFLMVCYYLRVLNNNWK